MFSVIIKGQKINDRYQIIRSIGEGGMANVYLAHDTILDRDVAVKILRGDLAGDEKFVRRFQREAISASSLNHPNIVEMYDVGEDDGKYFIVMEYVEGKTLKSLIKRRGALTLPEVIDIMLQLTSGIAHAHDSYIIHRDIKPQNVLILEDGTVKITDFGIAMALNSNELTQTNSVMGSVHYLPPEQANGTGATIKSDIYSLGILMFELLTGKIPFKGDNAVEIAIKQMKDRIPSVCEVNPEIPQSIENVILKACAKNPKNRYNSALEMHEDIKTALNPERSDEPKLIYQYPEEDFDETKKVPSRSELNKQKKRSERSDNNEKKTNKALWITGAIATGLILLLIIIFFVVPRFGKGKEVEVPDVAKMTVAKASNTLEKAGLKVDSKTTKKTSEKIKKGYVISTNPPQGRNVKKGTKITLIVSSGPATFKAENYVGKSINTVKAELEEKKITVEVETKEVSASSNVSEGQILEQKNENGETLAVGDKLKAGDTVILVVPEIYTEYPDFVNDNWTESKVRNFCDKHGVVLTVNYEETDQFIAGYVMNQSRTAGTKVTSGAGLRITVAKKKATPTPTATPIPTPTATPTPSATPDANSGVTN